MYMNGRGPGMNGHRGPMGGPAYRRPMRTTRRPTGFFPMGGLFILPGLLFGGWITAVALAGILSLFGSIIGSVFGGLSWLISEIFSGGGVAAGAVIGLLLFIGLKKKRDARKESESIGTVDGEEVDVQIAETPEEEYRPETRYMGR